MVPRRYRGFLPLFPLKCPLFTLTGIHCPTCGLAIKRMKHPLFLHYIYYHCTRTKDSTCREGSVQELYIDTDRGEDVEDA